VRMPQDLKRSGETVLAREGMSVTNAIRGLYRYLDARQTIPVFLKDPETDSASERIEEKRSILRGLIGRLPSDSSPEQIRDERLSRHFRAGIQ
ncbi:MAG: hypothetical protein FWD43_06205, partial [Coriobacteriia bacterium]|nr:hypothetical protein [Coriobacteriia bacterium]